MAGANTQQYGIKNWRIYREPIDGEAVHLTYQEIKDRLITNEAGDGTTLGTFYGGLITSVTSDANAAYNGPWYISYNVHFDAEKNKNVVSYSAERIPLKSEIDRILYAILDRPKYTKPKITVQFLSAVNGEYTTVSQAQTISEDVEIMSSFTPALKINWPARTEDNENGTRAENGIGTPDKPNYLLGYSYGVDENAGGILYNYLGSSYTAYSLDILDHPIQFSTYKVTAEGEYVIFDDLKISYLEASYMYYPQLCNIGSYEISYGEGNTMWFGKGIYIPDTVKYVVNAKWKYYWGLTDKVPGNEEQLKSKDSGFLNNSNLTGGTITSTKVGEGYNCKSFWIAYPVEYGLANFNGSVKIQVEKPDGTCFDLISISDKHKIQTKTLNVTLPDNTKKQYIVDFIDDLTPIGNKYAIISFKIVPSGEVEKVTQISLENGSDIMMTEDERIIITESFL